MSVKKFKAKLLSAGEGGGVYFHVPFDVEKEYGKKNLVPVKATFDGEPYRGSIANMGDGHCLHVLKSIREKIKKQVGDYIDVTIEHDTTPRVVEIPDDVKKMLSKNKTEKTYFDSLAFTHKKEYVKWITDAKREETRNDRLQKMLEKLKSKMKNPTAK